MFTAHRAGHDTSFYYIRVSMIQNFALTYISVFVIILKKVISKTISQLKLKLHGPFILVHISRNKKENERDIQ